VDQLQSRPRCPLFPVANGLDNRVKTMQKPGTVFFLEGSRATSHYSDITQVRHQIPCGEGITDGIISKNTTFWPQYSGPFFQAPRGERDVHGDHNIVLRGILDNPVIRRIEMLTAGPESIDQCEGFLESSCFYLKWLPD